MLKIGLTGGIGSGKTTAARVFEMLGAPIYFADARAKELMHTDELLRKKIQETFGDQIYKAQQLDRKALAKIVFNDEKALEKVNGLVHPVVRKDFHNWAQQQDAPYVIEESAILFETGLYIDFDYLVSVISPMEERIARLQERDNTTVEKIEARMKAQVNDEIRKEKSDYILKNGKDDLLLPQIIALDKVFKEKV
ncbi:dephospho-CoA kinase [Balneicella halophila]|uniref:Dephospho-CoA kinase n=1 Tax=Balneicella halophila TaxID=1537566 RepID=A0A7L4UNS8_BALHA|nr:dephospho-CoA kinase [Balneicella halophila]PVX50775.1 dephospho-CoA kinase [Balneicella halophila]